MKQLNIVLAGILSLLVASPSAAQPARVPDFGDAAYAEMAAFIGMIHTYVELVEGIGRIAENPSASGIAALLSAREILERQSPQAAIEYFNKLLEEVKDPVIRRALRMQLAELYRNNHQPDRAMEHLRALIVEQ